ncbi:hypothetical protein PC129_g11113 [Phytophthora cactorum]|uniref:Uncharacterized protein n=1 Tax=Phytophthora cactorum TaxID=29920 RepID=A0A8T1AUN7_9STRA|nr:hypothetical protein Pcac1_g14471 [Phytophthora cactorum]KAG2854454.1 hypothetical protein PC113_g13283 [Phytophthora cactorum]KAG2889290.1 hypothetical protein PC117_g24722 [Phytophthora cactorum]KAG3218077.1 hypothetical protein PC129_g11113 [Phytophthora cactorum]KAG4235333.1 hypothetical protein PC116_g16534 [Phytophthora cactorum]
MKDIRVWLVSPPASAKGGEEKAKLNTPSSAKRC